MCGIFGIVSKRGRFQREVVDRAIDTIAHRGPDSRGCELEVVGDWDVWLGHRRLSILDLSPAGHQPMEVRHAGTRGSIVFNGEIYNHRELHDWVDAELDSGTDTEVLLRGMLQHGPSFLEQTNGMFAFALLDLEARSLTFARDRLGKKPLYVLQRPDLLVFASELKAFEPLGLDLEIDPEALALYHWLGFLPGPTTIWRGVEKFPASSFASLDLASSRLERLRPRVFWDPIAGYADRYRGTYETAVDDFLGKLDEATEIRLDADVPVGAFLSGGIDSSLVVSSIAALHHGGVQAFTVKPDDPAMDESDVAFETARRLGIECDTLPLRFDDYEAQYARIPVHYDEPFADFSAIPTLAISEAARKRVTVVLTGDGGDEVFLGYPWLSYPGKLWSARKVLPSRRLRSFSSSLLGTDVGNRFVRTAASLMNLNPDTADLKTSILRETLSAGEPTQIYDTFKAVAQRPQLSPADLAAIGPQSMMERARDWYPDYAWEALEGRDLVDILAALDTVTFLRDDILVKVDRATMAFGLEARSPLLDHRIARFAQSLPTGFKIRDGRYKALLRDALDRRLPGGLSSRGKMGFGAPYPSRERIGIDIQHDALRWAHYVEREWRKRALGDR